MIPPAPSIPAGVSGSSARGSSRSQAPSIASQITIQHGGFLVGGDYSWNESFITGVFGGYGGTDANYANSGRTQSNAFRFGTYASYSIGGFYSNAIIGAAFTGYNVDRPIEWTGFERDASSKPTGGEFFSLLALGYDWTLGNFTFGPSVSAQYTYLAIGSVTESGAGSLNLRVPSFDTNSFRSYLGGHVAYTWTITDTIRVIPEVRMFWQHEFLQDPSDIDAALDGGAGPEFFYRTSAPSRDAVFCGAGLIVQLGNSFSANVYYDADFGRSNLIYQLVSTGFELKF